MKKVILLFIMVLVIISCKQKTKQESKTYETIGYLEKLDDKFYNYVPANAKLMLLQKVLFWTEGPVWMPKGQFLLFSDVPKNIAYKWTEKDSVQEFLNPSGYTGGEKQLQGSNGLILDKNNDLILCQTGDRAVARYKGGFSNPTSTFKIIANRYKGKRLNAPNDITADSKEISILQIQFFGMEKGSEELDFQDVYKINTNGDVQLLTSKWPSPNGIGISPNEKTIYISNSEPAKFIAYDLSDTGMLSNERILLNMQPHLIKSIAKQKPDGMAIKKDGTIFLTGPDGVFVIQPVGKHLGTIKTDKLTSNCTFNEDESVLYITCHELILRLKLKQ